MPLFHFKLLGSFGDDRTEDDIEIPFDFLVKDVKGEVRKTFKIIPALTIDLMFKGKKLEDHEKWGMLTVRPFKDTILVIGYRND